MALHARAPTTQDDIDAVLESVTLGHAGFTGYLEAVAEAITGTGGREVTLTDGRRSIELVTAIYTSARNDALYRCRSDRNRNSVTGGSHSRPACSDDRIPEIDKDKTR